jgi:Fe-S-cluster containining protein
LNKDFICQRCGQCCIRGKPDVWITYGSKIETHQKYLLLSEKLHNRKFISDLINGCEMLVYYDGMPICLIEYYYGRNKKPKVCRDYPLGDTCHRMQKEKLNKGKVEIYEKISKNNNYKDFPR